MKIEVRKPSEDELRSMGVFSWPVWNSAPAVFDWSYPQRETCYILEGRAIVRTDEGSVSFGKGDLVVFPEGLSCEWKVEESIRKHYRMG
ncbi:DUF861 domain-containing protein [Candidatus Fermentibacteria bacterium]|nr:DUF861 domain-containing protein [Candidatus Fermentibacteria bacterium]